MYRKIVWCYIIVLTLLDISLNTKLSAQGKSHGNGVSVHETLVEGISIQDWGGGSVGAAGGVVSLQPAALSFGRRALAAAHALTVTLTNTANETIHLASVAGTTPDFHASFFHSKVLACGANTTFSVVYLGRREGPAHAHLYIHTSKGVHEYPVSAVGVASEYRVWPLVGLRVPQNATLEPLLTLYNPTDTTIQVLEVYSSGAWVGLALPDGRGEAPRALWSLPPRTTRPLVRLRLRLPPPPHQTTTLNAYIRIKGNMPGGGLVVGVEVTPTPPGEFLSPAHVRLRTRGHKDKPDTMEVLAGSTAAGAATLAARATGACRRTPPIVPLPDLQDTHTHNGGAGGSEAGGVEVTLLRTHIEPYQDMMRAAELTLDYGKMWASYEAGLGNGSGDTSNGGGEGEEEEEAAVYCAGWVALGRAALPYSLRLLPGTLAIDPTEMHFVVSAAGAGGRRALSAAVHNQFPEPLRITHVHFPHHLADHFITESLAPLELAAGARGVAARVQLREGGAAARAALRADIVLHTNLSDYTLPLLLYDGLFNFEWEKDSGASEEEGGAVQLGGVGARGRRELGLRLHNTGLLPLCLTRLHAELPPPHTATIRAQERCAAGGSYIAARLVVSAGGGAGGAVRGAVEAHSPHGAARAVLLLHVLQGDLSAAPLHLSHAAPYVRSEAPLELSSSLPQSTRVTHVTQAAAEPDPAIQFILDKAEVQAGARSVVGRVRYSPEQHCAPRCATGLDPHSEEGQAWVSRGQQSDEVALQADAALQQRRRALHAPRQLNYTLYVHTTEVVQVPVAVSVEEQWPRVWQEERAEGWGAGLCGVGSEAPLLLRLVNPASTPLLLQPRLTPTTIDIDGGARPSSERDQCVGCVWSAASFSVGGWRDAGGGAGAGVTALTLNQSEYLLLAPRAQLELSVTFAPTDARPLAAYLYLRNNLTIVERVLLRGRGARASFEVGGRKPNSSAAIVVEAVGCGAAGGAGAARRTLVVRNTGRVPLRLQHWRVAGQPCAARALRLQPCAPLLLQPGEARPLHLHYHPDWTRSTTQATVSVMVGNTIARFSVVGAAPARLVGACSAGAGRAPLEGALRWAGGALALLAGAACLACAALDAERHLRAHRAARPAPPPPHAAPRPPPLDLRALAAAPGAPAPAPPPPPARPRRAPRPRRAAPADPAAERRAFERWRAGVSRRAAELDDEERSSEEGSPVAARTSPPPPDALPAPSPVLPRGDASSSSPDSSPAPRDSYSNMCHGDEEGGSSSESSSPGSGGDPRRDREPPWPRPARRAPRPPAPDHHHHHHDHDHAPHAPSRGCRLRRSSAEARRSSRASLERRADTSSPGTNSAPPPSAPAAAAASAAAAARAGARPHARKDRPGARRRPDPPAPAASSHPPHPAPPRAAPPPPPPPSVRWGASWSDVVSRGNAPQNNEGGGVSAAPLAPIGSDVRRRLGSHSLFYYGGAPAAWPPAEPAPAARPPPPPPPEESSGGYRSLEMLWSGGGAEPLAPGAPWLWGGAGPGAAGGATAAAAVGPGAGGAVRPPPGFPAPQRTCRPYDPFQSLASIWTPAALDWRLDAGTPPPAPAPSPPRSEDAPSN